MEQLFGENITTRTPLPAFDDARPLGPGDEAFMRDMVAVLAKHGNENRFGLCLLHDHFPIASGEILLETNDPKNRTLSLRVVKETELRETEVKITSWRLTGTPCSETVSGETLTACAEDKCKIDAVGLTACAEDKCKIDAVGLTACAEDKCKIDAVGLTACAEDKCKIDAVGLTACAEDKCK